MIRAFSDLDLRSLKTMKGELVSAVGGTRAASQLLPTVNDRGEVRPLSESRISGYCTVSDMTRFMPIHHVVRLEIAAGQGIVSKWMTDRLVRDGTGTVGDVCDNDLRRISREVSDLIVVTDDALADGNICSAERAAMREAIRDLERELSTLKAKVAQP
ncbi:hypothetical protein [Aureimonas sp. D3]|uniref:hypothetical protein n=1 Tax=Aureimonas sp. D3 TaxID=1638164 RepID=UPI000784A1FA|nr:hypothetical protein [Aureimonas sp. D3]